MDSNLIYTLIFGAVAGWLAGLVVGSNGFGIIGNIVIGILGAYIGPMVLGAFGISLGATLLGRLFTAAAGAIVLTIVLNLLRTFMRKS